MHAPSSSGCTAAQPLEHACVVRTARNRAAKSAQSARAEMAAARRLLGAALLLLLGGGVRLLRACHPFHNTSRTLPTTLQACARTHTDTHTRPVRL